MLTAKVLVLDMEQERVLGQVVVPGMVEMAEMERVRVVRRMDPSQLRRLSDLVALERQAVEVSVFIQPVP